MPSTSFPASPAYGRKSQQQLLLGTYLTWLGKNRRYPIKCCCECEPMWATTIHYVTLRTAEATNLHPTVMAFRSTVSRPLASGATMCCWLMIHADRVNGSVCTSECTVGDENTIWPMHTQTWFKVASLRLRATERCVRHSWWQSKWVWQSEPGSRTDLSLSP